MLSFIKDLISAAVVGTIIFSPMAFYFAFILKP
jgi:ABC-type multidrug transport system permease subunit